MQYKIYNRKDRAIFNGFPTEKELNDLRYTEYDLKYESVIDDENQSYNEILENLFNKFQPGISEDCPTDYEGEQLKSGDVMVLNEGNGDIVFYIKTTGFAAVNKFFQE